MNREFLRFYFYSLILYIFKKVLIVVLVIDGFFYCKEYGNIKCFICDVCYLLEDLEKYFKYFFFKSLNNLYEIWCLIFDYGNILMY